MADGNKSHEPTPRRRQKAREKGQVARGRDLTPAMAIAVVVFVTMWQSGNGIQAWRIGFRQLLAESPRNAIAAQAGFTELHRVAMFWAYPAMAGALLIAIVSSVAQGGLVLAPDLMKPKLERLSPASKMKQLFSVTTAAGLAKSLLPTALMSYLVIDAMARDWRFMCSSVDLHARSFAGRLGGSVFETAWKCGLVLLGWGLVDFFVQRRKHESDLRMTHEEVREEAKESEGNPQIKARIRKLQRQVRRKRMLQDVTKASVVVTNPTHYAIALEYSDRLLAPVVVAKGRNLLAQQIKEAARWHEVPMVENVPLAHALYRTVEVGQAIPAKLYAAVAEVLAFIMRAQTRVAEAR